MQPAHQLRRHLKFPGSRTADARHIQPSVDNDHRHLGGDFREQPRLPAFILFQSDYKNGVHLFLQQQFQIGPLVVVILFQAAQQDVKSIPPQPLFQQGHLPGVVDIGNHRAEDAHHPGLLPV